MSDPIGDGPRVEGGAEAVDYQGTGGVRPIVVSDVGIGALRGTRPWILFMSVMTFVGAGVMVLGAGVFFMMTLMHKNEGPGVAMGVVYLAIAVLYIAPGIMLWRYAKFIGSALR